MDQKMSSGAGQGFGVAGFVIGIIALILSFIPCIGMYALLPGIIALVFATVGLVQASGANAPRGLIIAALVISVIGTSIAAWQFRTIRKATRGLDRIEFHGPLRDDIGNEIRENIRKALEGIEEGIDPDTIPFDTTWFETDEMIEELERLEREEPADPAEQ